MTAKDVNMFGGIIMLISIDHGNSEIKTVHDKFSSGFVRNPSMPQMAENWIKFNGSYYALTGRHLPYHRDKTQNDDYYILTLFAIAKEMLRVNLRKADIKLSVGLPPAHMQELMGPIFNYFVRNQNEVSFIHNGIEYDIRIINAYVFPQAYPAVYEYYDEIASLSKAYIIDIGGYTTDVLMLRHGKLDLSCCYSLESGVIKFYNRAASVITSRFGGTVDETDIRNVLNAESTLLSDKICQAIMQVALSHTNTLLESLQDNDIDLGYTPAYFVGGGSLLLRQLLLQSGRLKKVVFITDTLANAKGYDVMAKALQNEK